MNDLQNQQESCPAQTKPVVEFLKCPECNGQVETWSDEELGTCKSCDKEFPRS